jgi:[ribosomal protein S5]-alanine N-acetyltransferase
MPDFELRPWTGKDLDALVRHANDPAIAANMTDTFPSPYSKVMGRSFLDRVTADDPPKVLAIVIDGEPCGSVGCFPQQDIYRRNAELGYWLSRRHWGQGIMTKVVRDMTTHVFRTFPGINRVFARPFGSNAASQRVLEKAGFTLEARLVGTIEKNGHEEDELIYAVRRSIAAP